MPYVLNIGVKLLCFISTSFLTVGQKCYTALTVERVQTLQQLKEYKYLILITNVALYSITGAAASELVIHCTATGIQLQCHMKYYTSEMNIAWYHG